MLRFFSQKFLYPCYLLQLMRKCTQFSIRQVNGHYRPLVRSRVCQIPSRPEMKDRRVNVARRMSPYITARRLYLYTYTDGRTQWAAVSSQCSSITVAEQKTKLCPRWTTAACGSREQGEPSEATMSDTAVNATHQKC